MRADMAKVLVERPRFDSRDRGTPRKGYKKRLRRMLDAGESPPIREGMMRPYGHGVPAFNEHLSPLRRYVQSQVGRPWDKVHSEICAHIDRGNVVQKHILTHLYDYVLTRVLLIDGQPCWGDSSYCYSWYGRPLRELSLRQLCYVCPKSGLLKRVPPRRTPRPAGRPAPPAYVRVNDRLQCRFIAGRWEVVALAPLPDDWHRAKSDAIDPVLGKPVCFLGEAEAKNTYGAAVYATCRRVLRKAELRQYPIPIDFIR